MALILKSEATESFISAVQAIEDTGDLCCQDLPVFAYPGNLASWAVLSRIVLQIEQTILDCGYRTQSQSAVQYNLARGGAQALAWISDLGAKRPADRRDFRCEGTLLAAAEGALWNGVAYESFTTAFPLWHKSVLSAEIVGPNVIRFGGEDPDSRRVRAYLQGLRPASYREVQLELGEALEPAVKQKIQNIVASSGGDRFSVSYSRPTKLYRQLHERYFELSERLFRHDDTLVVGAYTLGDFRSFYAGLLAVCAVHEHSCYLRALATRAYPANSGVIVNRREEWVRLLSRISHLPQELVASILSDLALGATKTLDLYVHPFVPLGDKPRLLGVIPHFPLKSQPDENVLRACSLLRPSLYDAITSVKEEEMRKELKRCSYAGFRIAGPRLFPGGDIDLVVEDIRNSAVVIGELKWLRKAIRSLEHIAQQASFLRGAQQLRNVREFLRANPRFLVDRGDLSDDLSSYKNVYYVLVPRDYFVWVDPSQEASAIDFDPFSQMLSRHTNLVEGMEDLLKFNWLPEEGRDFQIASEPFTVKGATVETEVIYARY